MSIQAQITLRTRKLGVLIRDARAAARMTIKECATAIGITPGILRAWEEGRRAPSLPELEVLSYYLDLPILHFWRKDAVSDDPTPTEMLNLPALADVRQRMIGVLLRQEREKASLSLRALAEQSRISVSRLRAFELGDRPVPVPELEVLVDLLGGQVETFFDTTGPIGQWMLRQNAVQDFLQLPPEYQDFVCKPVNLPYLELALKLSSMSVDKLRSVAEGLLDITL
ncbi:MAG: XRE family transcriptional regulator [Anaerolineales bacterium]|nr:XRE family transcriptional regulator [Anaerolineales bacterium]